ncbi:MAG: ACP S-malonyltransferase [Longimicrobiales bacterium]|nr:ACP S-malonyltransferase [Longimicrobiales bacterium]
MALALLFPGQGSQVVGMGRALAETYPAAAAVLAEADETLGLPLSRLMGEGPEEELTATKNAQPAILAHSVAVLRVLQDRLGGVAMAAGHSLGEFSALVAAGALSFPDALEVVRLRGELMYAAGKLRPGTMAAVLGLGDKALEDACARVDAGICVPANFNSSGQIVVSGDLAGVEQGMALFTAAGAKRVLPLNVSGAFHSPLMEPAARGLREKLESVSFRDPAFPVFSNVTAGPVTSGAGARKLLVEQLTSPVRWAASVAAMVVAGADRFLELGPGSVLCGLNKRNAKGFSCTSLGEPADIHSFQG